jgi:hypothetical protein
MSVQHLLITDVDAIQRYVFASVRMATIVGASRIVATFDAELETLATDLNGEFQATRAVLGGGNGLFVFSLEGRAEKFAEEAVKRFRLASVSGTLTASEVVPFEGDDGYPAALKKALQSLESRKLMGSTMDEQPDLGLAWRCEYCGAEAALPGELVVVNERRRIGPACQKKLESRNETDNRPEKDFNILAGDDYLAIMVIDGDGLGRRLRGLKSPESYADFSRQIKDCINRAIENGKSVAGENRPFHILYQGGDDLVIACPSQWALPFAEAFSESLAAADWTWAGDDGRVGFSIGISIANSGFPFRVSHQIASELLRSAKRAAHDQNWPEGAIDFALITEASGDAETLLKEREIASDDCKIMLTGRPYRLAKDEAHSLSKLRQACEELRKGDFSQNRLFSLRNTLTSSRIDRAGTSLGIAAARETVRRLLNGFEARIERFPSLKTAWASAMNKLSFEGNVSIFPHGDLADALYLWEHNLGNQN